MKRKIIIDTDPGHDDAFAILIALASPDELEVLGVVGVAGNVPLRLAHANARKVIELAGRIDVRVYAGCERPIRRPLLTAEYVHGQDGLGGPALPDPSLPLETQHGVDFIIETLRREAPGTVTLCPLGPLTNIAMAFIMAPDVIGRVKEIVLMGGGFFEGGNVTPAAEFNIYVDPDAADIVLRSGVPITMMPLDVTHTVLCDPARTDRFRAVGRRAATATAQLVDFFQIHHDQKYGWNGAPLHDPCVIAYLLEPDMFESRLINVTVETGSELTMGMTVADYWGVTGRVRNVNYVRRVDVPAFFELMLERISRLP